MDKKHFSKLDRQGHECTVDRTDDLLIFIPGETCTAILRRWIRERFLISENNCRSYRYIRSKSAITYERTRHIRQYYYMIHPFSDFRLCFEVLMVWIYTISLFFVVADLAFQQPDNEYYIRNQFADAIILSLDAVCVAGILVNFCTGYVNEMASEVYMTPRLAAKYYFKGLFFVDLISSIPFNMITTYHWNFKWRMLVDTLTYVFRVLRFIPLLKYYNNSVQALDISFTWSKAISLVFLLLLFLHWSACVHYFMAVSVTGNNCTDNPNSWLVVDKLCNVRGTLYDPYIESLFRAFSNTFHLGHGHSRPITNEDMIVSSLVMTIGHVLLFMAIANILYLVNARHSPFTKYSQMSMELQKFASQKRLPEVMKNQLQEYYDFRYEKSYFNEQEILGEIPSHLKEDILFSSCRRLVENVSFFNNIPISLLRNIITILHKNIYLPNDTIIKAGLVGTSMYFIKTGTVAVYTSTGNEVCHLEAGEHFGEIALVMHENRIASVVAVEMCEIYQLDKAEFLRVIAPFPDLLSKIEKVATDRLEKTLEMDTEKRRRDSDRAHHQFTQHRRRPYI